MPIRPIDGLPRGSNGPASAISRMSEIAPMPIRIAFFSYRRAEPDYGGHVNAIALND